MAIKIVSASGGRDEREIDVSCLLVRADIMYTFCGGMAGSCFWTEAVAVMRLKGVIGILRCFRPWVN